jgi:hypothetical protein
VTCRDLKLDAGSGTLHFEQVHGFRRSVCPLADGQPALRGGRIIRSRQGGDVLAVLVEVKGARGLYFISVTSGTVLGTFPLSGKAGSSRFALSRDGRRFAWLLGDHWLEVRDVPGDLPPVFVAPLENAWIHFGMLAQSCLLVRELEIDMPRHIRSRSYFRWDQGRLEVTHSEATTPEQRFAGAIVGSKSLPPGLLGPEFDPDRYVQLIEDDRHHRVLIDRYNHLVFLGRNAKPVCIFYLNGSEVAAWLPDGTCWGSRRLIGCEPASGAAERIAAALSLWEKTPGRSP